MSYQNAQGVTKHTSVAHRSTSEFIPVDSQQMAPRHELFEEEHMGEVQKLKRKEAEVRKLKIIALVLAFCLLIAIGLLGKSQLPQLPQEPSTVSTAPLSKTAPKMDYVGQCLFHQSYKRTQTIPFSCSPEALTKYNYLTTSYPQNFNNMTIRKMPYSKNFHLVERQGEQQSLDNFAQVVLLLQLYQVGMAVYIHSAPAYLSLVLGAASDDQVKIILGLQYQEIGLTRTGFSLNGMLRKIRMESKEHNLNKAGLVVTTDVGALGQFGNKPVLLYVHKSQENPGRPFTKLVSTPACSELRFEEVGRSQGLSRGIYLTFTRGE